MMRRAQGLGAGEAGGRIVPCPVCRAGPGESCADRGGARRPALHSDRLELAAGMLGWELDMPSPANP